MDLKRARDTIENVFSNEFDRETFIKFASNLLNSNFSQPSILQGNQIPEQFKDGINSLETLSNYVDSSQKKIDLLIVTLIKDTALDRRRTMQRNFVARYLDNKFKDAALVAFVTPRKDNWRFSLIQIESRLEGVKVVDDYTPAKRWSFLLGKNEGCHTAKSQLLEILANDSEDPSLEEFIEAFNIETVSKEFYEKYRELFDRMTKDLKELIENDFEIEKDFREKQIKPRDFARKTMGQIAFLYFLQKKGWFGVRPEEEWGTGVKNFVRKLFERRASYGNNFFNDILEPLFYEALALDRGSAAIYPKLNNVRLPFLNGGLFEPLNGYSWETTNITLPDEFFSNTTSTEEGDIGNGVLDVFDRYNFTVNESEPLEMEVAVDPEMLGKVFENLIPENIRKGKGAYYTPRSIVHYMCQESLINYLDTELSHTVEKETIEAFIRDESGQMDLTEELKKHAQQIDELLANIKVCDPAVGSGAFPLGLLNEIVKARVKIGEYIDSKYSIYDLKLHAISNSIYGVDIDPGAIEIAKLRFWLSLVVEQDEPSPLPNLDHKIMQGNSLISEYEGIRLFDDKLLENNESRYARIDQLEKERDLTHKELAILVSKGEYTSTSKADLEEKIKPIIKEIKSLKRKNIEESGDMLKQSSGLFDPEVNVNKQIAQNTARALNANKAELLSTHSQSEKERLKKQIEELTWRLIEITLQERGELDKLEEIKELRLQRIKPFFIWELEFGDVFKNNGGFDVVIANPPYLKERDNAHIFEPVNNSSFGMRWHQGKMDFWFYFLHKSIELSKSEICFITSRYWLNSQGAKKLIKRVADELSFVNVVDIGKLKVFDAVAGHHMISHFSKKRQEDFTYFQVVNDISSIEYHKDSPNIKSLTLKNSNVFEENNEIIFSKDNFSGLEQTLKLGELFDTSQGVIEAGDKISKKQFENSSRQDINQGDGVFVLNEIEANKLNLTTKEKVILKPYVDPNDVSKYDIDCSNLKYLIYSDKDIKENIRIDSDLFNLKNHLDFMSDFITSSNKPYGLHRARKDKYFELPKIIFKSMFLYPDFAYDENKLYFGMSFTSILQKDDSYHLRYLLTLLNSSFAKKWFYVFGKQRGVGIDIGVGKLRLFPVKVLASNSQEIFIQFSVMASIAKKVSEGLFNNICDLIDALVLQLYFSKHMIVNEIDILKFIERDLIEALNNKDFMDFTDNEQKDIINNLVNKWTHPDSEVNKRINSFESVSPDILKPFLES
jgi:adenine-specific DNA-methyltransferase